MSYKAYRLRQRKSDGSYDIILLASRSDLALRFKADGTENGSVETALTTLEGALKTVQNAVNGIDMSTKITKVADGTAGNIPMLTVDGALTDSGKKPADFAAATHNHTMSQLSGTPNSIIVTGTDGTFIAAASVTPAELAHISGLTSNAQTQLNAIKNTADTAASNLSNYVPNTAKGSAGGVVPLNDQGLIDATYLPGYVDDVIEGYLYGGKFYEDSAHTKEIEGTAGKIYVELNSEKTYRWSGTVFSVISETIALGETSTTAYRGDRGKIAYDHSQAAHARADATAVTFSSNGVLNINGTATTVYAHPTYSPSKSTASKAITAGTFTALTAITNTNGHITGYTETTYTLPAAGANIQSGTAQPTNQNVNDLWFETLS
ncbi:hypothetical protein [uncultured Duncaniella sp.]|uniref:hypothetical protein n=1 Tax=uncultured Duncaniella sp. TaxID=2768039 RepID=UPI00260A6504|nr:hypothetical protein [uncultured Duncaniella sp.]